MDLSELVEYAYGDDELMKLLEDIILHFVIREVKKEEKLLARLNF